MSQASLLSRRTALCLSLMSLPCSIPLLPALSPTAAALTPALRLVSLPVPVLTRSLSCNDCLKMSWLTYCRCSYNAVNGVPSCMNGAVNNDLARERWGMEDGVIVSDCGAVGDPMSTHYIKTNFDGSPEVQAAQAVKGGCDYNCGKFYASHLHGAVAKGALGADNVDRSAFRLLKKMFRLGLFNSAEQVPYAKYGRDQLDTVATRQIALDGATQSIVLLQNNHSGGSPPKRVLPLAPATRVALIGPHMNASDAMLSNYKGSNNVVYSHTPLLSISKRGNVVAAAKGSGLWTAETGGIAAASAAAKKADVAVVFLGLYPQWFDSPGDGDAQEGEDQDRQVSSKALSSLVLSLELFKTVPSHAVCLSLAEHHAPSCAARAPASGAPHWHTGRGDHDQRRASSHPVGESQRARHR